MFLGLKAEAVHVNALGRNIFVMLIRLNKVKIPPIPLRETIVTIKLKFGGGNRVPAILEGDGDVNVVGTTSRHAGHGADLAFSGTADEGGTGVVPATKKRVASGEGNAVARAVVGGVVSIGVVEPLLAVGSAVGDILVGLYNPN